MASGSSKRNDVDKNTTRGVAKPASAYFRGLNVYDMTASTSTLPPLEPLLRTSVKRTRDIFAASSTDGLKDDEKRCVRSLQQIIFLANICSRFSLRLKLSVKVRDEYKYATSLPPALLSQQSQVGPARPKHLKAITAGRKPSIHDTHGYACLSTIITQHHRPTPIYPLSPHPLPQNNPPSHPPLPSPRRSSVTKQPALLSPSSILNGHSNALSPDTLAGCVPLLLSRATSGSLRAQAIA